MESKRVFVKEAQERNETANSKADLLGSLHLRWTVSEESRNRGQCARLLVRNQGTSCVGKSVMGQCHSSRLFQMKKGTQGRGVLSTRVIQMTL